MLVGKRMRRNPVTVAPEDYLTTAQEKMNVAMSEKLVTVSPQSTLEEAAQLLLEHKIGGLPAVENKKLVGIITTSDILQAFLDVMGASQEGTSRIDLLLEGGEHDLANASKIVSGQGGEVLGLGTYREKWGESPVCYLRMRTADPERIAEIGRASCRERV